MVYPVKRVYVNTPYGVPGDWAAGYHPGIDFDASVGTAVYATKAGVVVFRGTYGGWGQDYGYHLVVSSYHDGRFVRHIYAHGSSWAVGVGARVGTGQYLGRSGNTGRTSGPHLHYEERHSPFGYYDHYRPVLPYWQPAPPKPIVHLSKLKHGKYNIDVLRLKLRLNKYFPKMTRLHGLKFNDKLRDRYAMYQRNLGYTGKNANGIPGRESLEKLGFKVLR